MSSPVCDIASIIAIFFALDALAVVLVLAGMPICGTSVFSLIPVVLAELLGPQWITSGMGIQMCFQGVGLIVAVLAVGMFTSL